MVGAWGILLIDLWIGVWGSGLGVRGEGWGWLVRGKGLSGNGLIFQEQIGFGVLGLVTWCGGLEMLG
jgi:hypothetical protein